MMAGINIFRRRDAPKRSYRLKGNMTVFVSLIFMAMCMLSVALLRSAVYACTLARIDAACALAAESAFAGYSSEIFEKYGILTLKDTGGAMARVNEVIRVNMNGSPATVKKCYVTGQSFMTDSGGDPFFNQAVEYMKLEGFADYSGEILDGMGEKISADKAEKIGHIAGKLGSLSDDGISDEEIEKNINEITSDFYVGQSMQGDDKGVIKAMKKEIDEAGEEAKIKKESGENVAWGNQNDEDIPTRDEGLFKGFRKIQKILTGDITALVLHESLISDNSVPRQGGVYDDNETFMKSASGVSCPVRSIADTAAFREYIMLKFNSYTDIKNGRTAESRPAYEIEYIIAGRKSDRDNLNEVMKRLSLIRQGLNMTFLFTHPEKREQAAILSAAIFGFTLNPLIIKGGEYAILAAWSYAEAIMDLKLLYSGKKVPIIKNENDWNLSLDGLLAGQFTPDESRGGKGLDYEMYLRSMLALESSALQCARAMDVIEMYMRETKDASFRMRDCVFSQTVFAEFTLPFGGRVYGTDFEYGYGSNMFE